MKAFIDRIEGKTAVLIIEPGKARIETPLADLPRGAREGDWLAVTFAIDQAQAGQVKAQVSDLLKKLKAGK